MEVDDVDVDHSLLRQFSCMGTNDREALIGEFIKLVGTAAGHHRAVFYLDMNNWNVQEAVGSYFDLETGVDSYSAPSSHSAAVASSPPNSVSASTAASSVTSSGEALTCATAPCLSLVRRQCGGSSCDSSVLSTNHCSVVVAPCSLFVHRWNVRNSGQERWPLGCCIRFLLGERLADQVSIPLPCVDAGCEQELCVSMRSPLVPGLYSSQWRACTSNGHLFGDVLPVEVRVRLDDAVSGLTRQMTCLTQLDSDDSQQTTSSVADSTAPCPPYPSPVHNVAVQAAPPTHINSPYYCTVSTADSTQQQQAAKCCESDQDCDMT